MKTYKSELDRIGEFYENRDYKNTCIENGDLIEGLVGIIYPDFHNHFEKSLDYGR